MLADMPIRYSICSEIYTHNDSYQGLELFWVIAYAFEGQLAAEQGSAKSRSLMI